LAHRVITAKQQAAAKANRLRHAPACRQVNTNSANLPALCYPFVMTRTEAIAIINAKLAALDDERVITVADIVKDMTNPAAPALNLTDEERAAIERSKEDFKAGRTYSSDQYRVEMTAFMTDLKSNQ
jgi:hypothetical protein